MGINFDVLQEKTREALKGLVGEQNVERVMNGIYVVLILSLIVGLVMAFKVDFVLGLIYLFSAGTLAMLTGLVAMVTFGKVNLASWLWWFFLDTAAGMWVTIGLMLVVCYYVYKDFGKIQKRFEEWLTRGQIK